LKPLSNGAEVFVFMTLHYPSAEAVDALAQDMAQMRGWMENQPGCLGVDPPLLTEDGTCLVGYSRWQSKEALLATGVDLDALRETPAASYTPRQPYFLTTPPEIPLDQSLQAELDGVDPPQELGRGTVDRLSILVPLRVAIAAVAEAHPYTEPRDE
jgi:hypothetical protein